VLCPLCRDHFNSNMKACTMKTEQNITTTTKFYTVSNWNENIANWLRCNYNSIEENVNKTSALVTLCPSFDRYCVQFGQQRRVCHWVCTAQTSSDPALIRRITLETRVHDIVENFSLILNSSWMVDTKKIGEQNTVSLVKRFVIRLIHQSTSCSECKLAICQLSWNLIIIKKILNYCFKSFELS